MRIIKKEIIRYFRLLLLLKNLDTFLINNNNEKVLKFLLFQADKSIDIFLLHFSFHSKLKVCRLIGQNEKFFIGIDFFVQLSKIGQTLIFAQTTEENKTIFHNSYFAISTLIINALEKMNNCLIFHISLRKFLNYMSFSLIYFSFLKL